MDTELLQTVYRTVIIAKLLYASSSWWGFTTASDIDSAWKLLYVVLNALDYIHLTNQRLHNSPKKPTTHSFVQSSIYSEHHVLHSLLPERTNYTYNLRSIGLIILNLALSKTTVILFFVSWSFRSTAEEQLSWNYVSYCDAVRPTPSSNSFSDEDMRIHFFFPSWSQVMTPAVSVARKTLSDESNSLRPTSRW